MPELSRFLGIVVAIYYRDHPPPHFHAVYGGFYATVAIKDGEVAGEFPRRALANIEEWRILHREELLMVWELAQAGLPLPKIAPLE